MTMIRDLTYVGERIIPAPLDGPALRYALLPKANVDAIAIHHWTGWLPPETWTAEEEIAYVVRIDEYHRTDRGLDGIGYQLAPFPSGRVYIVSRLDHYGAHVGYENNHLIGIGLPGSFRSHLPSPRHLAATVEAVRYVYDYLGRVVPTTPHFYWGGTTCPGERWPEWVPQLRAAALQEEDMAEDFTDKQKEYLAGLMRGHVLTLGTGHLNSAMRTGDPDWVPPRTLLDVMNAIGRIPASSGGGLSEAQIEAIVKRVLKRQKLIVE